MNKVIVITGPTAVGKTKLSIELAKKYNLTFLLIHHLNKEGNEYLGNLLNEVINNNK